ncbi:MAG: haloacid dehalogenase-like hydrolase [Leptospiraceae bacterium]|nr:haloacid dehalogenase-like hydrolase [Leptospiraceae bacterium]
MNYKKIPYLVFSLFLIFQTCEPAKPPVSFSPIQGFSEEVNNQLRSFFEDTKNHPDRKIAVFDGDGTVLGQAPHYLADECLYEVAKQKPEKKPEVIKKMVKLSNVSMDYVQLRVHFFEGDSLEYLRELGRTCYHKYYKGKVFSSMVSLIDNLKKHNFEVWIVTASPEAMYQKFLSEELHIPITHIIGVKSVIREGKITSEMVQPIPQDNGKMEAIETFVQGKPLLVGGNSRGDKEMIEYSAKLKLIVNPDEHVAADQKESIASYAKKSGWLIVKQRDVPSADFPNISKTEYNIRVNKTNE